MTTPKLLSGDNPQIPLGYGEAPIAAYIAAVPGWKQAVCAQLDALISAEIPSVVKAIKWNSPMYGMEKDLWFLTFHCFTRYVKVGFFRGAALNPPPPEASKQADIRYLHVRENAPLDEAQFKAWVRQAAALPGMKM